ASVTTATQLAVAMVWVAELIAAGRGLGARFHCSGFPPWPRLSTTSSSLAAVPGPLSGEYMAWPLHTFLLMSQQWPPLESTNDDEQLSKTDSANMRIRFCEDSAVEGPKTKVFLCPRPPSLRPIALPPAPRLCTKKSAKADLPSSLPRRRRPPLAVASFAEPLSSPSRTAFGPSPSPTASALAIVASALDAVDLPLTPRGLVVADAYGPSPQTSLMWTTEAIAADAALASRRPDVDLTSAAAPQSQRHSCAAVTADALASRQSPPSSLLPERGSQTRTVGHAQQSTLVVVNDNQTSPSAAPVLCSPSSLSSATLTKKWHCRRGSPQSALAIVECRQPSSSPNVHVASRTDLITESSKEESTCTAGEKRIMETTLQAIPTSWERRRTCRADRLERQIGHRELPTELRYNLIGSFDGTNPRDDDDADEQKGRDAHEEHLVAPRIGPCRPAKCHG
ncbi:hypothetical protein Taro_039130, partial [Colocasia esculenta]|nr:hypothetical protein [Colocasia esculenta]